MNKVLSGALGALLALVSLLLFPTILQSFSRQDLTIRTLSADVVPGPHLEISSADTHPFSVDGQLASADLRVSPGLHFVEWSQEYRGGHKRSVGHAQLVGPFQDPQTPQCGLSLLIAPSFLDQLAPVLRRLVQRQLKGMSQWPLGSFLKVKKVRLQWIRWTDTTGYRHLRTAVEKLTSKKPGGHLRVSMHVDFENALVPMTLIVVPIISENSLRFRVFVDATLDLDNRFFQWVADFFDGNDRVSKLIGAEVKREMRNVLDKPPDIPLDGGGVLQIRFCQDQQLRFHEAGHVSMQLAIQVDARAPAPPRYATKKTSSAPMSTPLALEIDRNGLGAILHTLWADGTLDRSLANTTKQLFNDHPTVRTFLSLRIDEASFDLPPTIDALPNGQPGLRLRTAAKLTLRDGDTSTQARLFAQFDIGPDFTKAPSIGLGQLNLSCIGPDNLLQPCYAQIIAQVRANREQLQQELGNALGDLLGKLFTGRTLTAPGSPASYVLESTEFHLGTGILRANLHGTVQ